MTSCVRLCKGSFYIYLFFLFVFQVQNGRKDCEGSIVEAFFVFFKAKYYSWSIWVNHETKDGRLLALQQESCGSVFGEDAFSAQCQLWMMKHLAACFVPTRPTGQELTMNHLIKNIKHRLYYITKLAGRTELLL